LPQPQIDRRTGNGSGVTRESVCHIQLMNHYFGQSSCQRIDETIHTDGSIAKQLYNQTCEMKTGLCTYALTKRHVVLSVYCSKMLHYYIHLYSPNKVAMYIMNR